MTPTDDPRKTYTIKADWSGYFLVAADDTVIRLSGGSKDQALFEARERGFLVVTP